MRWRYGNRSADLVATDFPYQVSVLSLRKTASAGPKKSGVYAPRAATPVRLIMTSVVVRRMSGIVAAIDMLVSSEAVLDKVKVSCTSLKVEKDTSATGAAEDLKAGAT